MSSLEPFINILVLLTVLSIAAERATNFFKLRDKSLREATASDATEKEREHRITVRSLIMGIAVAILVKANLFEIWTRIDAPWDTLGWLQQSESKWVPAAAAASVGTALYALIGSALTGIALGFGSKFWHEILDGVVELRGIAKKVRKQTQPGGA
jgi:cytochrome c biogenesis factor